MEYERKIPGFNKAGFDEVPELDEADKRILREIQKNPDITMRELGEKTGLSHTPCWRRLGKLKEAGIVDDKRYIVNASASGFEIVVFCFVRMKQHDRQGLTEFEQAVSRIPEVTQCYSLTGEHDYILRVIAKSVKDYEEVVKNSLVELPHVQLLNTSLALNEIKNSTFIPV